MVSIACSVESTALGAVGCCHQQLLWPCHETGAGLLRTPSFSVYCVHVLLSPYVRTVRLYF